MSASNIGDMFVSLARSLLTHSLACNYQAWLFRDVELRDIPGGEPVYITEHITIRLHSEDSMDTGHRIVFGTVTHEQHSPNALTMWKYPGDVYTSNGCAGILLSDPGVAEFQRLIPPSYPDCRISISTPTDNGLPLVYVLYSTSNRFAMTPMKFDAILQKECQFAVCIHGNRPELESVWSHPVNKSHELLKILIKFIERQASQSVGPERLI